MRNGWSVFSAVSVGNCSSYTTCQHSARTHARTHAHTQSTPHCIKKTESYNTTAHVCHVICTSKYTLRLPGLADYTYAYTPAYTKGDAHVLFPPPPPPWNPFLLLILTSFSKYGSRVAKHFGSRSRNAIAKKRWQNRSFSSNRARLVALDAGRVKAKTAAATKTTVAHTNIPRRNHSGTHTSRGAYRDKSTWYQGAAAVSEYFFFFGSIRHTANRIHNRGRSMDSNKRCA